MDENTPTESVNQAARLIEVSGVDIIVVSILVLYLGMFITRHIAFLKNNNIPAPVTGGIICSLVVAFLEKFAAIEVTFDLELRDTLLLVFFSTIGLNAKFKMLAAGGKALIVLLALCSVFLVLQDLTGIGVAILAGEHPGYGLMGGSISFAGGHGTAIAWGEEATKAGLEDLAPFGIACATFGLIVGGVIGGPLAGRLIKKHGLEQQAQKAVREEADSARGQEATLFRLSTDDIIGTIFALGVCLGLGELVNRWLFSNDIKLPGFLTAMLVGIVITNASDRTKASLSKPAIDLISDASLLLFLTMSLMSMNLLSLLESASLLMFVVFAQMLATTMFAVFIVFRVMGRDYDAAVISGGFVGMGLGATPVAIANMDAVTRRYGPSPKAFLIIPLVGAFFMDLVNALVIKFFIGMPFWERFIP